MNATFLSVLFFTGVLSLTGCKESPNEPAENQAPSLPKGGFPADLSVDQPVSLDLSWKSTEPDGDSLFYDVYFGTEKTNLTLLRSRIPDTSLALRGLPRKTTCFWQVVAIDQKGLRTPGPVWQFSTITEFPYGSFTYDGFTYRTIRIGNLEWTVDNLRTTHYNDGRSLTHQPDPTYWWLDNIPVYCAYGNDKNLVPEYGYLYNGITVQINKIAPKGWRIPTLEDWKSLISFVADSVHAGTKLKSEMNWTESGAGTDRFGFTVLPAGIRFGDGTFRWVTTEGYFWTATKVGGTSSYYAVNFSSFKKECTIYIHGKTDGMSIRLVRDL